MMKKDPLSNKSPWLSPTNIYELAENRLRELVVVERQKAIALQKYPEGKIHVLKTKGSTQYYLRTDPKDKTGKYIHKKETSTIKRYLQKAYDEKVYKLVKQEVKSIQSFLKHAKDYNLRIQNVFSDNPIDVKSHIHPIDCSNDDYIGYWQNKLYVGNSIPITTTEYRTDQGELVRSKSEMNIANALLKAGIPYKYEYPLTLYDGRVIYPDFTVLDVYNRQLIYWEHRGMMDDREYVRNAVKKTKDYIRSGITMGETLIITEETGMTPLGTDEINEVIKGIKNRQR